MSTVASLPAAYVPASYQATLFGIDDPYVDTSLDGIRRTASSKAFCPASLSQADWRRSATLVYSWLKASVLCP